MHDRPCHRGYIAEQLFRDNFICFSSSLVRREVFDDVGFLNPEYRRNSDYDLWLRMAMRWPFEFVDEPLVFYRTGHLNRTGYSEGQLRHALCIMERSSRRTPMRYRRIWSNGASPRRIVP